MKMIDKNEIQTSDLDQPSYAIFEAIAHRLYKR